MQREAGLLDSSTTSQGLDEEFIGETNVYLTIFIDGICCVRAASDHLLVENSQNLKVSLYRRFRYDLIPSVSPGTIDQLTFRTH
jgi:hypothetical protein